jgi:hypothetical protein
MGRLRDASAGERHPAVREPDGLHQGWPNDHLLPHRTQTVAHGLLEDGRSFLFHRTTVGNKITSLKIDFE